MTVAGSKALSCVARRIFSWRSQPEPSPVVRSMAWAHSSASIVSDPGNFGSIATRCSESVSSSASRCLSASPGLEKQSPGLHFDGAHSTQSEACSTARMSQMAATMAWLCPSAAPPASRFSMAGVLSSYSMTHAPRSYSGHDNNTINTANNSDCVFLCSLPVASSSPRKCSGMSAEIDMFWPVLVSTTAPMSQDPSAQTATCLGLEPWSLQW